MAANMIRKKRAGQPCDKRDHDDERERAERAG
jgi:hypothetical protein